MPNQNTRRDELVRKVNPRHDKSFKTLSEHCSRDELATCLGVSDDPRVVTLVTYLLSPNRGMQRRSLANLAAMADLSYSEVLRAITNSRVSEGILRMSKQLPQMMEDAVVDAMAKQIPCDRCKGTGNVMKLRKRKKGEDIPYETCWSCEGTGKKRQAGDKDARALVFESVGMTNRKSPLFNINLKGNAPGELPSVESEMGALDKMLDIRPIKEA